MYFLFYDSFIVASSSSSSSTFHHSFLHNSHNKLIVAKVAAVLPHYQQTKNKKQHRYDTSIYPIDRYSSIGPGIIKYQILHFPLFLIHIYHTYCTIEEDEENQRHRRSFHIIIIINSKSRSGLWLPNGTICLCHYCL